MRAAGLARVNQREASIFVMTQVGERFSLRARLAICLLKLIGFREVEQ